MFILCNYNMNKYAYVKPKYYTDNAMGCAIIEYPTHTYHIDPSDRDRIINFGKKFMFANDTDIYPSFMCN